MISPLGLNNISKMHFTKKTITYFLLLFSILFLCNGCLLKPPAEKGVFLQNDLVELIQLDSSLKLDIRYATSNNFTEKTIYPEARAFLQRTAALALIRVNAKIKSQDYCLLIYDGYRPWSATKKLWYAGNKDEKFVANPKEGSKHNRGCAVDLTLYNIKTNKEIEMTSTYDEMTERSFTSYKGGTIEQRAARDLLIKSMEAEGFISDEFEWWHFNFIGWEHYKICNIPFSEIK